MTDSKEIPTDRKPKKRTRRQFSFAAEKGLRVEMENVPYGEKGAWITPEQVGTCNHYDLRIYD